MQQAPHEPEEAYAEEPPAHRRPSVYDGIGIVNPRKSEIDRIAATLTDQDAMDELELRIRDALVRFGEASENNEEDLFLFGLTMRQLYDRRAYDDISLSFSSMEDVEGAALLTFKAGFLRKSYGDACAMRRAFQEQQAAGEHARRWDSTIDQKHVWR